jgi:hypothetical protein
LLRLSFQLQVADFSFLMHLLLMGEYLLKAYQGSFS